MPQQQRQAVSHREGLAPPVEGGRPRSRDGALLCPAQFPGAPEPLVTHDLIGINSYEDEAQCDSNRSPSPLLKHYRPEY